MPKPRKARKEGAAAKPEVVQAAAEPFYSDTAQQASAAPDYLGQRVLEAREAAAHAADQPFAADEKQPKHYGAHLNEIVAYYREKDPKGWAEIALTPLQHGVEAMAHRLAALK